MTSSYLASPLTRVGLLQRWSDVLRGSPRVADLIDWLRPSPRSSAQPIDVPREARDRLSALVLGLVLVVLAALTPFAYASPPDPSWIPGIYDDGDNDEIVSIVMSGTGATAPAAPLQAAPSPAGILPALTEAESPRLSPSAAHPRAPPAP